MEDYTEEKIIKLLDCNNCKKLYDYDNNYTKENLLKCFQEKRNIIS